MRRESVLCPQCGTAIDVPALNVQLREPNGSEGAGSILKRCPRCRTWSWMSLQAQEAS